MASQVAVYYNSSIFIANKYAGTMLYIKSDNIGFSSNQKPQFLKYDAQVEIKQYFNYHDTALI